MVVVSGRVVGAELADCPDRDQPARADLRWARITSISLRKSSADENEAIHRRESEIGDFVQLAWTQYRQPDLVTGSLRGTPGADELSSTCWASRFGASSSPAAWRRVAPR